MVSASSFIKDVEQYRMHIKERKLCERIQLKDLGLWEKQAELVSKRLGWLETPQFPFQFSSQLESLQKKLQSQNIKNVVHIGMGGSSLFAELLAQKQPKLPYLVCDSPHVDQVSYIQQQLNAQSLFVIASKSGTTIETRRLLDHFWAQFPDPRQYLIISDEDTPLAQDSRFKADLIFTNPSDIGGRFSALSFFGLIPALLLGFSLEELKTEFKRIRLKQTQEKAADRAAYLAAAAAQQFNALPCHAGQRADGLFNWLEQLLAESTGKENQGILPVLAHSLESPYNGPCIELTGPLQRSFSEEPSTEKDAKTTHPFPELKASPSANDRLYFQECYTWMWTTALLGHLLNLNPFDEPNVDLAKKLSEKVAPGQAMPEGADIDSIFSDLISLSRQPSYQYLRIVYYGNRFGSLSALEQLETQLKKLQTLPVSLDFGPRYLHASGQFFKGGANCGLYLFIYAPCRQARRALSPSQERLDDLSRAQFIGDVQAMRRQKRRVFILAPDEWEALSAHHSC